MMEENTSTATEMTQPVIIDLGKQKPRALRELKQGEGKLWNEVMDVVDEVKEMLGTEAEGKVLVPVIMLYQERFGLERLDIENLLSPLLDDEDDDDDDDDDDDKE